MILAAINNAQWGIAAAVVLGLLWNYRGKLADILPKRAAAIAIDLSPQAENIQDMEALQRLTDRALRSQCKEFIDAIKLCQRCFFEDPIEETSVEK